METIMCPPDKVGRVIGRAGATIRDLEASTGTRIQVDHKAPGDKPVTISGRADEVERAKRQVLDLISGHGSDAAPAPGEAQKTLECPQGIVGRVIGRGGETIRTLQQASGAHILVNQDFPEGAARQITISGSQDAVDRAASMVQELIGGEHANTSQVVQRVSNNSGAGNTVRSRSSMRRAGGRDCGCAGQWLRGTVPATLWIELWAGWRRTRGLTLILCSCGVFGPAVWRGFD